MASCKVLFEQDRAWSIPIDGPTIQFVLYDPIGFSLEVVYANGDLALLADIDRQITTQIINAPSREDVVLGYLNSAQHIGQPTNIAPPKVIGWPFLGNMLYAYPGEWCYSPSSFLFQWLRDGSAIGGATSQWYQVQSADSGHQLAVQVIAVNAFGHSAPIIALAPLLELATEGGDIITTEGGQPLEITF